MVTVVIGLALLMVGVETKRKRWLILSAVALTVALSQLGRLLLMFLDLAL